MKRLQKIAPVLVNDYKKESVAWDIEIETDQIILHLEDSQGDKIKLFIYEAPVRGSLGDTEMTVFEEIEFEAPEIGDQILSEEYGPTSMPEVIAIGREGLPIVEWKDGSVRKLPAQDIKNIRRKKNVRKD